MRLHEFILLAVHCILAAEAFQASNPSTMFQGARSSFILKQRASDSDSNTAVEERKEQKSNADESSKSPSKLPTVIQQIADERMEFRMNLGRAIDVLRTDMQDILTKKPDFSIYHEQIEAIDPSGVQLKGLDKYKSAFAFFQTFVKFWFSSQSRVQYRMVYDLARATIRISWNLVLVPKVPLGRPLYVDGISHYTLDSSSGKITEHKVENLLINNTPVAPPYGILNILQQDFLRMRQPQAVPGGVFGLAKPKRKTQRDVIGVFQ